MKTFIITTTLDITPKDIQDYIWMNEDAEFALTVVEVEGVKSEEEVVE